MRAQRAFSEENDRIQNRKIRNCICCPYGYHIDLDFVRYCETLANTKPSEEQLLRRSRRRSRKSMEFMLGLENLFDAWDRADHVQSVPEASIEIEPDSPRISPPEGWESSSTMKFTYSSPNDTYPRLTSSSTSVSSHDIAGIPERISRKSSTNSPPETSAFLHDALDEVCSDFERTLERASLKKKNIRRNDSFERHNHHRWDECIDIIDSCVGGDKPRSSKKHPRTQQQKEYEIYAQVEKIPPPPPPRRHIPNNGSSRSATIPRILTESEESSYASISNAGSETPTEAYTLYNIRQQMAMSLKRMKDLEEKVKSIPELQNEITVLRDDKRLLQQALQRKDEELLRSREFGRFSSSPSPCSPMQASPVQFAPQRISPISLESLGMRFRTNSCSSEPAIKLTSSAVLKRDVATMCGVRSTRDIAVGSPIVPTRSAGTNPINTINIKDDIFTQREVEDRVKLAVREFEDQHRFMRPMQNFVSVETQTNFDIKKATRDSAAQTLLDRLPQKFSVGVNAKVAQRDSCVSCKPDTRSVGSSDHRTNDCICDRCSMPKRSVASGTEDSVSGEKRNSISLKLLEMMPARSATFSLGENEKLNIKRKTIGTQCMPRILHSVAMQTDSPLVSSVGVQKSAQLHTTASQCSLEYCSQQTDTRDLLRLQMTRTTSDEISPVPKLPPKPIAIVSKTPTHNIGCNTDYPKTMDHGVNTIPPAMTRSCASNTEEIPKRDKACGDAVKPHISIACAENYCDSCKEAIKLLAKDFSKVITSPVLSRDSKIPRPMHITSPNPVKKIFMRQNTYTITPSPTPSPIAEKRTILSSLAEKPTTSAADAASCSGRIPSLFFTNQQKHQESDEFVKSESKRANYLSKEEVNVSSPVDILGNKNDIYDSLHSSEGAKLLVREENSINIAVESNQQDNSKQETILNQLASDQEAASREKILPTKEVLIALKVVNDSLLEKSSIKAHNMKSATVIVEKEWFRITSTEKANPSEVEDFLTIIQDLSNGLLSHVVNLTDNNGNTAMHYAVSHGNFDVVSILLNSKVCIVNQTNNAGYTCVMLVSLAQLKNSVHRTVVQRLFQMADVNIRAKKHCQTALMLAVSHGNLDMVEMLLAAGANINLQDEDGSTALMCAAEHGRADIVKHLLSQPNCDSLIQDVDGSSAFKIAWQAGHRDIGLLLYVHEQMLRSKMPSKTEQRSSSAVSPRHHRRQPSQ